jgi:hypothetical protein
MIWAGERKGEAPAEPRTTRCARLGRSLALPLAPRVVWLWLLLAFGACGCNGRDADRLANLGTKLERRAESLLAPDAARLLRGWRTAPFSLSEGAIDARVSSRLNWDKALADTPIQAKVVGGVVELHGKVRSEDQRRRAYELALTTEGVEKVLDRLEIGEPEKN